MEHIEKYKDLINDSLFEEAYILLEQDVKVLNDKNQLIERNRLVRDFFVSIFENYYFNEMIDKEVFLPLVQETVKALYNKDFLKDQIKKFPNYVDQSRLDIMFSYLVQNKDFEYAKNLLPLVTKNITNYPTSMNNIIQNKNSKSLEFLCRNLEDIHFNEGSLLKVCSDMSTDTLRMLIDEFKFDINEQSKADSLNLVHTLLLDKNVKNFSFIVENYGDKIDWSAKAVFKNKKQQLSVLDLVEMSELFADFYNIILDNLSLKENIVDKIGNVLLTNPNAITQCANSTVYDKLFSHPNFNPKTTDLKQNHLIYGLLSEIGKSSHSGDMVLAKNYYNMLNSFLHSYISHDEYLQDAPQFNVVGVAIEVVEKLETHFQATEKDLSKAKIALDAATLIIRRYKNYINKPNPDGRLSIEITTKDSNAYRLLVNNGALTAEPEPGFFNALTRMMGGRQRELEKQRDFIVTKSKERVIEQVEARSEHNDLKDLKVQIRDDFRTMRGYIGNPLCDPSIKFKCENMFLKSERLVNLMEKYKITKSFEDMIFLGKNFSDYLKESLQAYIAVCEATNDFSDSSLKHDKLEMVRKKCLAQVDLLSEQVDLINQNISAEAEGNALKNLNIQGRFLKNRFDTSGQDLGFEKVISDNMKHNQNSTIPSEKERKPVNSDLEKSNDIIINSKQKQNVVMSNSLDTEEISPDRVVKIFNTTPNSVKQNRI